MATQEPPSGLRRWLPSTVVAVLGVMGFLARFMDTAAALTVDLPLAVKKWLAVVNGIPPIFYFLVFLVFLVLVFFDWRRGRKAPASATVPNRRAAAGAGRLADSLALRQDLVSLRFLRSGSGYNAGEVAGFSPREAIRFTQSGVAEEHRASLRRAIKRVLLEIDELRRAHERRVTGEALKPLRDAIAAAIEGYFQESVALQGPEALEHRRAWADLAEAYKAGDAIALYEGRPASELQEWKDKYQRMEQRWKLEA